ncbi:alpha/beta hydrolase family protein [Variibacter gotjawalensis]|uniref:Alpha/beta hydrolase family protein n=1 Tax=Variibacter gotjawalensis TaxID=1333996 RepID=A0A0S3PV21_9BRAD|nr:alpha/beta hydrolase [Variibacter gotjawalensis]NIK50097.1 hypothetical protein [Variibacter gotjawalensis]RZS46096.1 hypothetical protein EV661_4422 [Variibacter gotjawalensis]BAT59771.1 alpha/beta hydrolase family protein [Variibacter gotjawalensis]
MRTSDADILILPGWTGSGPDHWQTRWENKLTTARRVAQHDWEKPVLNAWVARLAEAVEEATRPVVLVAHSLGINTVLAGCDLIDEKVVGAYLVAPVATPSDGLRADVDPAFFEIPPRALPFPSVLIGSASDPLCTVEQAEQMAAAFGSEFVNAGDVGHMNTASGHGPWPDGLLRFGKFLSKLTIEPGPTAEPPYAKP